MALFGHGAMSDLSPFRGHNRNRISKPSGPLQTCEEERFIFGVASTTPTCDNRPCENGHISVDAPTSGDMSHEGPSDLSLLEAFHRVPDVFWLFRLQCLLRICVWRNHRVMGWRWMDLVPCQALSVQFCIDYLHCYVDDIRRCAGQDHSVLADYAVS